MVSTLLLSHHHLLLFSVYPCQENAVRRKMGALTHAGFDVDFRHVDQGVSGLRMGDIFVFTRCEKLE